MHQKKGEQLIAYHLLGQAGVPVPYGAHADREAVVQHGAKFNSYGCAIRSHNFCSTQNIAEASPRLQRSGVTHSISLVSSLCEGL